MAEVRISQEDLDSLGRKLGGLEPALTTSERTLLLYMFSLAADAISRSRGQAATDSAALAAGGQESTVVVLVADDGATSSIQDQFADAFTPGPVDLVRHLPGSIGPGPKS